MADLLKANVQTLEDEISLMKKAMRGNNNDPNVSHKVKVPEPKPFGGTRSAKELENFLWDMEQYFKAARIPDEEKFSMTNMYLSGDATLWWRTRMSDESRSKIDQWETLKKELKEQFLPCNT